MTFLNVLIIQKLDIVQPEPTHRFKGNFTAHLTTYISMVEEKR